MGSTIMEREEFVVKRIVSPDGKVIAELKSFVKTSGDGQSEISQSISMNVSSDNNSRKCSQSGFISISSSNE
jgi:hypothetical protein